MAYREFSTANADYVLQLGVHGRVNTHNPFRKNGLDALVLETGVERLEDCLDLDEPQYGALVRYCRDERIPIYGTDVRYDKTRLLPALRDELAHIPSIPVFYAAFFYGLLHCRMPGWLARTCAAFDFISQSPSLTARNAMNARKIEEFLAPRLAHDGRRPRIGLVYGAAHVGVEDDLKSKRRRDATLWNWRRCDIKPYWGFDAEQLDTVSEARYTRPVPKHAPISLESGRWEIVTHRTGLLSP